MFCVCGWKTCFWPLAAGVKEFERKSLKDGWGVDSNVFCSFLWFYCTHSTEKSTHPNFWSLNMLSVRTLFYLSSWSSNRYQSHTFPVDLAWTVEDQVGGLWRAVNPVHAVAGCHRQGLQGTLWLGFKQLSSALGSGPGHPTLCPGYYLITRTGSGPAGAHWYTRLL